MHRFPFIAPHPARLSEQLDALRQVEESGVFSNNGPVVRAFEAEVTDQLFGGQGASIAVANATLGLMIAIRETMGPVAVPGRLALMPALTFAATAQAALWAGLTPLVCDIDPLDWGACPATEERLLRQYGDRIAVIVPYATFGNAIDLDRYAWLQRRHGVGVVIDAAASLGTVDDGGMGFGANAPFAVVYSMHATKTFAVGEGGLIHSGDPTLIATLRAMTNFGFESGRSATLMGLNAKLPEIPAVMARAKLAEIDLVCDARAAVEAAYRETLEQVTLQHVAGRRRATQFMPLMLPEALAPRRDAIAAALDAAGIGSGRYFSPHIGEQPLFQAMGVIEPTPAANAVAGRMISLPITDAMRPEDAVVIAEILQRHLRARGAGACPRRTPREADRLGTGRRGWPGRHGAADRRDQARAAARSGTVRAGRGGARQCTRRRQARAVCDQFGQHRRDFSERSEGQCASGDCRAGGPSGGPRRCGSFGGARRAPG